ncbi:MAG TPA: NADH-quinone oxidoreductase subunit D [Ruminococcaceae bacterium]|jgi:ech hydrogenase subunit E|nr:NADH-quinone oxidoreductase subunit D [Oscillospiraceae bacterium]HBT91203.1 NADH-quinone oxidoreductase subunit D [Oscillospiraceae bacterium]
MSTRSVVPFGPHHPVLPEPIHLDLVLEDEKVVDVIPSIGFIHRGLEKLVEKRDFRDFVYVAERMCGICSFMHGMSYCEAVEHIMGVELPPRAKYLRTIWCELSRLHSHLLWLGLLADAFGFESLFMQCWRLREKILDMFEASTGGRLIFSVNKIGGQRRDMDNAMLHGFVEKLGGLEEDLKGITSTFLANSAVNSRLKGVGYMTKKMAQEYGVAGPFMRASGIARDTRKLGYDAYGDLNFEPITSTEGDCYARTQVRVRELFQSIDLIRQAVAKIPEGPVAVPIRGFPKGEYMVRVEQPRGEAIYYVKANGTKFLDRFRVRTPTFANVPAMIELMKGCRLSEIPMLILTIDPCVSCIER